MGDINVQLHNCVAVLVPAAWELVEARNIVLPKKTHRPPTTSNMLAQ